MEIWSPEIKELEKLYESHKGQLPDLEKELERLIKADDENMILLYSRRCLEVIITDLCECELKRPRKTEPLKGIIDKLYKEDKVPAHIITSMHGLNELSTYGAHPKDFDPEQVKPVLNNLGIIIKWYLRYKSSDVILKEEKKIQVEEEKSEEIKKETGVDQQKKPKKLNKNRLLSGVLIITVLVFAVRLLYPKVFKQDTLEKLRSSGEKISVAVMPFRNMTNDTTWNIWQSGIQDNLITSLSNSDELKVRQTESITSLLQSKGPSNYASITPAIAKKISLKLDANISILGSIKQVGTIIRLNAQLIDSKSEEVLKSFQIDGNSDIILNIIDSLSVEVKNFLVLFKLIKEDTPEDQKYYSIDISPQAYKMTVEGENAYGRGDIKTAINMFLQSYAIDSNFVDPILYLTWMYYNQGMYEESKKWCQKAIEKKDLLSRPMKIEANVLHALLYETIYEVIGYLKQELEIDDQLPITHCDLGGMYLKLYLYDKAITEFEKSLEIYNRWEIKPQFVVYYTSLGNAYHKTGQYKKEKKLYEKAEKDFPDMPPLFFRKAVLSLNEGDTVTANVFIDKYISLRKERSVSESTLITGLALLYSEAGILEKAEENYRKASLLEPENPERINALAYFLIDKDLNINEGSELIDKALQLRPDNYNYLHTKGWGMYKQERFQEAFDVLQKSWDIRRKHAVYDHEAFLHLEAAKKAVAGQKNN